MKQCFLVTIILLALISVSCSILTDAPGSFLNSEATANIASTATLSITPIYRGATRSAIATPIPPATEQPTATRIGAASSSTRTQDVAGCRYQLSFVSDITIPDLTQLDSAAQFSKTWRVHNSGSCAWDPGTAWVFAGGEQLGGPDAVNVPVTLPGETVDITVNLTAPATPGIYASSWHLRLVNGQLLSNCCQVRIQVVQTTADSTAGTTTPATATVAATPHTPTPTIAALQAMALWRGTYWSNSNLEGEPTLVREDASIGFNWSQAAPDKRLSDDGYSVRWHRIIDFAQGWHAFSVSVGGGMRLYLNDALLIDAWQDGSQRVVSAESWLPAGLHTLRLEYFEGSAPALIQLRWQKSNRYPQWRAEYWGNPELAGEPNLVRNDSSIDFDWGLEAPATALPADSFSARWTRYLTLEEGMYRFYALADDGVRVYVDDRLIINQWHDNSASRSYQSEIVLNDGTHQLVVVYYDQHLSSQIKFWFRRTDNREILE